jgi:hypothetical protein
MTSGLLPCLACKEAKPETDFYFHKGRNPGRNNRIGNCKDCERVRQKISHHKHKEKHKQKQNERNRLRKTGFTPELFNQRLEEQSAVCAICGVDKPGGPGTWQADHCHDTKKPRGLLCWHCNVALGLFKDNTESLQSAIDYLNKYTEE